jgi:hypothetical protein
MLSLYSTAATQWTTRVICLQGFDGPCADRRYVTGYPNGTAKPINVMWKWAWADLDSDVTKTPSTKTKTKTDTPKTETETKTPKCLSRDCLETRQCLETPHHCI